MNLAEYSRLDATAMAALVAQREVTPRELAALAMKAIDTVNEQVGAVVETYPDRIDGLDERALGNGPFRGVPFLIKDVFGHEAGRLIEFGSRLCRGMKVEVDTAYGQLVKAAGLNIIGRSAAPEYSMAGTTETALYGNTSTPWRHGFSAGGSTGGGMAAVVAGMVPVAHGTDIAGSIRIPASFCGGVGLKPSRGRVSFAPNLDENGYGLAQGFVQAKSVRDVAALLDCLAVPQPGDPFLIPRPTSPWALLARQSAQPLRIGITTAPLMGFAVDDEVARAVRDTGELLATMGHHVAPLDPVFDGLPTLRAMMDLWFFGFDHRLAGYAKRSGHRVSNKTLEPAIWRVHEYAKTMTAARFMDAMAHLNRARRALGGFFTQVDVMLSPTTARVAEPWGRYHLGRDLGDKGLDMDALAQQVMRPVVQHTLPHNIMGTPAISLPLAMHSNGLPIGVQLAAAPAQEHVLLQLATALEAALPWAQRVPVLHASR